MTGSITMLAPDIFTLADVFTPSECEELIQWGEAIGYEAASVATAAGAQMMPKVRNNDRATFEDDAFAMTLWERVKGSIPQEVEGCFATGLNERFRFYRYAPGQRFKRHKDGAVVNAAGDKSRLTLLVYLNEGSEGGETIFRDYIFEEGQSRAEETIVSPRAGMGLLFAHERWHEGAPVRAGRKYVLRTDVMYRCAQQTQE